MLTHYLLFPRNKPVPKHFYSAQIQKEADSLPPALLAIPGAHHAILWTLPIGVFYLGNLHLILLSFQQPKWMSGKKNKPKLLVKNWMWYTWNSPISVSVYCITSIPNMNYIRLILITNFQSSFDWFQALLSCYYLGYSFWCLMVEESFLFSSLSAFTLLNQPSQNIFLLLLC